MKEKKVEQKEITNIPGRCKGEQMQLITAREETTTAEERDSKEGSNRDSNRRNMNIVAIVIYLAL